MTNELESGLTPAPRHWQCSLRALLVAVAMLGVFVRFPFVGAAVTIVFVLFCLAGLPFTWGHLRQRWLVVPLLCGATAMTATALATARGVSIGVGTFGVNSGSFLYTRQSVPGAGGLTLVSEPPYLEFEPLNAPRSFPVISSNLTGEFRFFFRESRQIWVLSAPIWWSAAVLVLWPGYAVSGAISTRLSSKSVEA